MVIPYALTYTSTVAGSAPKLVQCEKCGHEYVYLLSRKAQGEGTSLMFVDNKGASQRAQERAANRLAEKLEKACDPVPCPSCGWFQEQMVARLRRLRYGWMATMTMIFYPVAAILLTLAILLTASTQKQHMGEAKEPLIMFWVAAGVIAVSAVILSLLSWQLNKRFDPNGRDTEKRIAEGKLRAISKDEFLKRFQQQIPDVESEARNPLADLANGTSHGETGKG